MKEKQKQTAYNRQILLAENLCGSGSSDAGLVVDKSLPRNPSGQMTPP